MRSLYTRLVGGLIALLLVVGSLVLGAGVYNARNYQLEVTQKLHLNLAENLVRESMLMSNGMIYAEAVEDVFHTLMVINPAIEVYLLNAEGKLLRYSAPQGAVELERISLEPLHAYLEPDRKLPILGDDPRNPGQQKTFSAAAITEDGKVQGYLYVVLESEEYASAAAGVWSSSALKVGMAAVVAIFAFAAGAGGLLFYFLTRRLRRLDASVERFCADDFERPIDSDSISVGARTNSGHAGLRVRDEIDRLGQSFEHMSHRIADQVQELKRTDSLRRQLIANVSHDLRTPLAALKGYLDTLRLKETDLRPEQRRQYLEIASKSSERLEKLIDELFELAKLDATRAEPRTEPFSVPELVHDVLQKFELDAKRRGVEFEIDAEQAGTFAAGEIGMIERVLENLLDNALRHMEKGGRIRVHISESGGRVRVRVSDTGVGIAPADLPHIFEHFYRAGRDNTPESGTGLGLAIVKRILELHRSTIEATSQLGLGTTFTFDLPSA